MSIAIHIPANLREFTGRQSKIEVQASEVATALEALCQCHPELRNKLLSADGELHSFINVFVDGRGIRDLNGLATKLVEGNALLIVPALAGG
jgi:molybdopterin converting factor small subunit